MGEAASLRPPMPLVAVQRWWVAMAVGLCSANFPIPLLPNQGRQVLTHLLFVETRGAKLEILIKRRRPLKALKRTLPPLLSLLLLTFSALAIAGPYPPAFGEPGSTAVAKDAPALIAWATGWQHYIVGDEASETWQTPEESLGPAEGTSYDIVSLGRGGSIILTFDWPISNGEGWDFAVFENSFNDTNLELAYVEVSSNGTDFIRFRNDSLTPKPVGRYGAIDPTDVDGLAGKYRQGFGTPLDLQDLAVRNEVLNGKVHLRRITHVRLVDIVGDGTCLDTNGDAIYDPYPTIQSAGFDLDAIGVRYEDTQPAGDNHPPDQPLLSLPANGATDVPLTTILTTGGFSDPDEGDHHLVTTWQISNDPDFSTIAFEETTSTKLSELAVPLLLLQGGDTYCWRVRFYDDCGGKSLWSGVYSFTTEVSSTNNPPDQPVLSQPQNDSINISSLPALEAEAFSDPEGGDLHELTRWQISSQADFSAIVFDQTTSTDLTSTVVPHESELSYGEAYYWRVKFFDNHGADSVWSEAFTFTTTKVPESGKAGVSGNGCFIDVAASDVFSSLF